MIKIIEIMLFIILGLMVGYICLFSLAATFLKRRKKYLSGAINDPYYRIAVLVPAYKEDSIIISTAHRLIQLKYPPLLFDIYIIADSLTEQTTNDLKQLPLNLVQVQFKKSTKTLALNAAMNHITKEYDIALVCDADNILHPDFLLHVNNAFREGYQAVQGQRVAKNMDSHFSILDAASEMINNHIFRKGHRAMGLSSSIIGSGMAFSYSLFKKVMSDIHAVGGFDKVLQLEMAQRDISVIYLEKALIFDEKIPHAEAFGTQRRRWLSSQFIYLKKFFFPGCQRLMDGNFNYFNLAVLHNFILPRVILLGILPLLFILSVWMNSYLWIGPLGWGSLSFIYGVSLLMGLPGAFFTKQFLPALMSLPKAFFIMLKGMLQIKGANKTFIHTTHHHQEISNSIFKTDGF